MLVGLYFDKKRPLATMIASAGGGLGAFIGPILCVKAISRYGWRGSVFIHSGVLLHLIVVGALCRPLPKYAQVKLQKLREERGIMSQSVRKKLIFYDTNLYLSTFSTEIMLTFLVQFELDKGLTIGGATEIYATVHLCGMFLRFFLAPVSGHRHFKRYVAYIVGSCLHGLASVMFLTAKAPPTLLIFCILFGCGYGLKKGLISAINAELFGAHNLLMIEGVNAVFVGFGAFSGPLAAGMLDSALLFLNKCSSHLSLNCQMSLSVKQ